MLPALVARFARPKRRRVRLRNVRHFIPEDVIVFTEGQRVKPRPGIGKRGDLEDGEVEFWSAEEDENWLREVGALK